jgi:CSLREA domain-containing protein
MTNFMRNGALFLLLLFCARANAQPANDHFANAEIISAIPFSDIEANIDLATTETTDPFVFCGSGWPAAQHWNSIWYRYTPTNQEYLNISTLESNYDTVISVYTRIEGELRQHSGGCNDDTPFTAVQAAINGLAFEAGQTYFIEVNRFAQVGGLATLKLQISNAPRYQVSKTQDTADGICDADCSLREAISASNNTPGAVLVPAGLYRLTLAGSGENANASGDLDITTPMSIIGSDMESTIIDAVGLDRIFDAQTGRKSILFANLTLRNGLVNGDGGAFNSPVCFSFHTFDHVRFSNNFSGRAGGAIFSVNQTRVLHSIFDNNVAGGGGGAMHFSQSCLQDAETMNVEVRDSLITNNAALATVAAPAPVAIGQSTGGGGVLMHGHLRLVNSTVSGNRSNLSGGGVLYAKSLEGPGFPDSPVRIENSTIANNIADFDQNNTGQGGGIRIESNRLGTVIRNSVFANNIDNSQTSQPDCSAASALSVASSYNHVRNLGAVSSCLFFNGLGDVIGADPRLLPLAQNGGNSATHAVEAGSPLIDSGDPAGCVDYTNARILRDQRGKNFVRLRDGDQDGVARCDKGAFEFGLPFADGFEN